MLLSYSQLTIKNSALLFGIEENRSPQIYKQMNTDIYAATSLLQIQFEEQQDEPPDLLIAKLICLA